MHPSTASLSFKLLSVLFAVMLAIGLIPAAAFAAEDNIAASMSSAESAEANFLETTMDSQDESTEAGFILFNGEEGTQDSAMTGDASNPDISADNIISQEMPLDTVVAQAESNKSFFLAQTLESTRTVPVVSAQLPIDTSQGNGSSEGEDGGPAEGVSSESTVVGSFEHLGMTFAIEAGGESVALVAADYAKLPEEFIEDQVVAIPGVVSPDGIDSYSVTRIANNAFVGFTKESANPDYTGCEALFTDEELLEEAGVDFVDLDDDDPPAGRVGILALGIPASVATIEDEALSGFDTLQYIVVSEDNQNYASYDGALYSADLTNLRLIPEGRVGTIRVAPSATTVDPEVFSHCPLVNTVVADPESRVLSKLEQGEQQSKQVRIEKATNITSSDVLSEIDSIISHLLVMVVSGNNVKFSSDSLLAVSDASQRTTSNSPIIGTPKLDPAGGLVLREVEILSTHEWQSICMGDSWVHLWLTNSNCAVWLSTGWNLTRISYESDMWNASAPSPNAMVYLRCERYGYNQTGWLYNDIDMSMAWNSSIQLQTSGTYKPKWSPIIATVSFNANGGSGGQSANVSATFDAAMPGITATKPTRTGYEFMGWYDNADYTGGTKYYNADGTSACTWNKGSATLYAGWKANNYTITWNPQGGSVVAGTDVTSQAYGSTLKMPATPTKEGYTFAGWWTTAESDPSEKRVGPGYDVTTVPLSGATYFARWNKVPGTVTLKAAGGTFTQAQVNAFNSAEGDHPIATPNEGKTEIEIPFDVGTKSFSLDLLKPTAPIGSTFAGWSPAFVPPTWNPSSLSWNDAVTYEATWTTNVYGVTYQDKNGNPLVGWSAWEGGSSLESVLPQVFNEATPESDRVLPEEPYKRGYTWVKWTREDTGATVTSIPKASNPITIVANFTADPYTVKVDLAGGAASSWPKSFKRSYDEPTIELPSVKPTRAGYVFSGLKAYASEEEDAPAVSVIDTATNASVDTLQPGKTYKVLNLTDGEGDIYDVKLLRAVWIPRIAVDVSPSIDMGILADFGTNTLKFQYDGSDYTTGDTENAYAPLEFVSYTTAPVGIVAVTDDTQDAGYPTRKAFAEKVFGGAWNKSEVSFRISGDPSGANSHSFSLGGSTEPSATGFLDGLTIQKPAGAASSRTTTFYLGMDFGDLTALDLLTKESGQIAKLYYTVALMGDPESEPSVLAPYDGNGILWERALPRTKSAAKTSSLLPR